MLYNDSNISDPRIGGVRIGDRVRWTSAAGVQRVTRVGGLQPDAGNHRGGALFAQGAPEMVPPGHDVHGRELTVCQQDRLRFVAGQRNRRVQQRLVGNNFAAT